jgi:hypothetical protein
MLEDLHERLHLLDGGLVITTIHDEKLATEPLLLKGTVALPSRSYPEGTTSSR